MDPRIVRRLAWWLLGLALGLALWMALSWVRQAAQTMGPAPAPVLSCARSATPDPSPA